MSVPWVERAENNEKKIEYLEDNIQDPVLKAGLVLSYSMFKVRSNLLTHLLLYIDLKECDVIYSFIYHCTVFQWHIQ